MLSASVSAHDFRSLEFEKKTREQIEEPSPRGVLEDCCIRSSDSETVSSKASTSYAEVPVVRCQTSMWQGFFRLWKKKSMKRLSSFPPFGVPKISRRRSSREPLAVPRSNSTNDENNEYCLVKPCRRNFTLAELQKVTNDFSTDNVIGKGGYAEVYKGYLENGEVVAIKRLNRGTPDERTKNFLTELGITVHVNHPNTAKLIGLGVDGGMHLVLQLSPLGSLANLLHGSKSKLNWDVRYKVALGAAKGLEYLHEKCPRRIIHRDIKAANILLTEDFEPQLNFGADESYTLSVPAYGNPIYAQIEILHGVNKEMILRKYTCKMLLQFITSPPAINIRQKQFSVHSMLYRLLANCVLLISLRGWSNSVRHLGLFLIC